MEFTAEVSTFKSSMRLRVNSGNSSRIEIGGEAVVISSVGLPVELEAFSGAKVVALGALECELEIINYQ